MPAIDGAEVPKQVHGTGTVPLLGSVQALAERIVLVSPPFVTAIAPVRLASWPGM